MILKLSVLLISSFHGNFNSSKTSHVLPTCFNQNFCTVATPPLTGKIHPIFHDYRLILKMCCNKVQKYIICHTFFPNYQSKLLIVRMTKKQKSNQVNKIVVEIVVFESVKTFHNSVCNTTNRLVTT